jgi:hypothetical protein
MAHETLGVRGHPKLDLRLSTTSIEGHAFFEDHPETWAAIRSRILTILNEVGKNIEEKTLNANHCKQRG